MPDLFSIECETCHARLKVKDHSAVGQILACPKCGSMIQVQPPADWSPPNPPGNSGDSLDSSGTTSSEVTADADSSAFDDIDSLLQQADAKQKSATPPVAAKPGASGRKRPAVAKPPVARNPVTSEATAGSMESRWKGTEKVPAGPFESGSASGGGPIVPGGEWTSKEAKARQRMLMVYGGSSLGILIGIGLIVGIMMQILASDDSRTVAKQAEMTTGMTSVDANVDSATAETKIAEKQTDPQNETDTSETIDPTNEITSRDSQAGDSDTATVASVEANDSHTGDKAGDQASIPTNVEPPHNTVGVDDDAPPGFLKPRDPPDAAEDAGVGEGAVEDLMKLSEFLESSAFDEAIESGMPAKELGGEFSIDKVYIEKPRDVGRINVARNMSAQITAIKLTDKSIAELIAFLESLTSVPITVDCDALVASGLRLTEKVSLNERDTSASRILSGIFDHHGLTIVAGEHGAVITRVSDDTVSSREYDISMFASPDEGADHRKLLVDIIQLFVSPKSWESAGGSSTIETSGNALTISQTGENHAQIKSLLNTIAVATEHPPGEASAPLPRHVSAIEGLKQPNLVEFIQPGFLRELPARLAQQHGITLVIDWESVYQEGWNVDTEIPFGGPGKTLYETFDVVLRSMGLSMVGYGEDLFLVSTPQTTAKNLSTEIYLLGDVVSDKAAAEKLAQRIEKIVAAELITNNQSAYYVARADQYYLLARVSQDNQIRIEGFLKSIRASLAEPVK